MDGEMPGYREPTPYEFARTFSHLHLAFGCRLPRSLADKKVRQPAGFRQANDWRKPKAAATQWFATTGARAALAGAARRSCAERQFGPQLRHPRLIPGPDQRHPWLTRMNGPWPRRDSHPQRHWRCGCSPSWTEPDLSRRQTWPSALGCRGLQSMCFCAAWTHASWLGGVQLGSSTQDLFNTRSPPPVARSDECSPEWSGSQSTELAVHAPDYRQAAGR